MLKIDIRLQSFWPITIFKRNLLSATHKPQSSLIVNSTTNLHTLKNNNSTFTGHRQVTTFILFGISADNKWWAFQQMGLVPRALKKVEDLQFFKLLGAGHGEGFSLRPDFGRYGLFMVWKNEEAADNFLSNNNIMQRYKERSFEVWGCTLAPISAYGSWSGTNPFKVPNKNHAGHSGAVAVLTRASIRTDKLMRFWQHVPETSYAIAHAPGLLASIGVGELPFIRQATMSFWESLDYAVDFAYKNEIHKAVIQKTRTENWYSEELFARFEIINSWGSWKNTDPLKAASDLHGQ